jgi:nitrate reductase cytochrome c-type subunit
MMMRKWNLRAIFVLCFANVQRAIKPNFLNQTWTSPTYSLCKELREEKNNEKKKRSDHEKFHKRKANIIKKIYISKPPIILRSISSNDFTSFQCCCCACASLVFLSLLFKQKTEKRIEEWKKNSRNEITKKKM